MNGNRGFTLVEIMIAVAIVAILAAVAVPSFAKYRSEARKAACAAQRNSILIAAEHWLTKPGNGNAAPTLEQLSARGSGYFKSEPVCPCGGTYELEFDDETKSIAVTCSEADHADPASDYLEPAARSGADSVFCLLSSLVSRLSSSSSSPVGTDPADSLIRFDNARRSSMNRYAIRRLMALLEATWAAGAASASLAPQDHPNRACGAVSQPRPFDGTMSV